MVNWKDENGQAIKGGIRVYLPPHVWDVIRELRYEQTVRPVRQPTYVKHAFAEHAVTTSPTLEFYNPPVSETAWFLKFIREHHSDAIQWPAGQWLLDNGEGDSTARRHMPAWCKGPPMVSRSVRFGPHGYQLLQARAQAEGQAMALVLRRLIRQVLGT